MAISAAMVRGNSLGARAKWLREQAGVPVQEAADAIGIARPTLSTIENDQDRPGRETLIAMANYYGVSVDWLSSGKGLPIPGPLTIDEARLLWFFRLANDNERGALLTLARKAVAGEHEPPNWITEPWRILSQDAAPKRVTGTAPRSRKRPPKERK